MLTHIIRGCVVLTLLASSALQAQDTYRYPLSNDLLSTNPLAPALIPLVNGSMLDGIFAPRLVPISTCLTGGSASGFNFEDDAGLQFNNPVSFIGCEYTLQFTFQLDDFNNAPQWVRLLSFTHTDDIGVYIRLTNAPFTGTLDLWPFGTVGTADFFDAQNFYQLTLTRECSGTVEIFINGTSFASFNDISNVYRPQAATNHIIFFQDHPAVLVGEASPGFISDLSISDFKWSNADIADSWNNFCPTLLPLSELAFKGHSQNGGNLLSWQLENNHSYTTVSVERQEAEIFTQVWQSTPSPCEDKPCSYRYLDIGQTGTQVYRLRLEDISGAVHYSPQISIESPAQDWVLQPKDIANQYAFSGRAAQLTLIDQQGKRIRSFKHLEDQVSTIELNTLAAGLYFLKIQDQQQQQLKKLLKH